MRRIGLAACEEDSTSSATPGADGGSPDAASTSDGSSPVGTDSGTPTSEGGTAKRPTGTYLRFAHLAESRKADRIDFCLRPKAEDEFTTPPVHITLGAPGLFYGEVGRFIPMPPGEYTWLAKDHPDCSGESIEGGDVTIPAGVGSWALVTLALTLSSTGAISLQLTDAEMQRDATQDRVTFFDGMGDRDAVLPVAWVGSTTVNLDVPNGQLGSNALLPAGKSGKVRLGISFDPEVPFNTIAGGHALVAAYGPGAMRVCDHDAPIPTQGVLSPCEDRR